MLCIWPVYPDLLLREKGFCEYKHSSSVNVVQDSQVDTGSFSKYLSSCVHVTNCLSTFTVPFI